MSFLSYKKTERNRNKKINVLFKWGSHLIKLYVLVLPLQWLFILYHILHSLTTNPYILLQRAGHDLPIYVAHSLPTAKGGTLAPLTRRSSWGPGWLLQGVPFKSSRLNCQDSSAQQREGCCEEPPRSEGGAHHPPSTTTSWHQQQHLATRRYHTREINVKPDKTKPLTLFPVGIFFMGNLGCFHLGKQTAVETHYPAKLITNTVKFQHDFATTHFFSCHGNLYMCKPVCSTWDLDSSISSKEYWIVLLLLHCWQLYIY